MRIIKDKYELLKKIGKGGMSTVYLAMDININKQWAVKEIHKNTNEYKATVDEGKILSEVALLKELDHYALPRIVDMIDEKDSLFVVMDYIEGETIRNVLNMNGPIEQEDVVKYGLEILEILNYLHSQNPPIIYRDLKPSNIMLKPDGHIKIIDFGIARKYKKGLGDTVILGTKGFVPPEQEAGKSDIRSDIYSFGVTLYQMLTNKSVNQEPYHILPITEINPNLSTGLEKIIDKCTKANPSERYQTVKELIYDLKNYKKLEEEYIIQHKVIIKKFKKSLLIGIIITLIGTIGLIGTIIKEGNDYTDLVSRQEININNKESNIKKAIEIDADKIDAYEELIKEYAKDGFNEEEATRFFNIFNKVKKEVSPNVNFEIGELFLTYFEGESDKSSRNSLLYSKSFFIEAEKSKNKEISKLAKNYVFLAEYKEDYIFAENKVNISESSKKESKNLLSNLNDVVNNISKYDGKRDIKYLKLITYETVMDVLENEKNVFISNNININEIIPLVNNIKKDCDNINANMESIINKKKTVIKLANKYEKEYKASIEYKAKKEK